MWLFPITIHYSKLISIENLFQAWYEFRKGKRRRVDIQLFERRLEDNLFNLHQALANKTYQHGSYQSFYVQDPKQRHIHKAQVCDRVIHHLLYQFLYDLFDKIFICDSYSCRLEKGTHRGVERLEKFTRRVSENYTKPCWVLKCDVKKFFASVDHKILLDLLTKQIQDPSILWLLSQVISSFQSELGENKGLPLGNLTSQIFANIYLNELDQFVKHQLKVRSYLRYADDFLILASTPDPLYQCIKPLKQFLTNKLGLELHPKKIILRKLDWGIDFLGYLVLPYYRLPRTKTKKRIFKQIKVKVEEFKKEKISDVSFAQTLQSYLGFLRHANTYNLEQELKNKIFFWLNTKAKFWGLTDADNGFRIGL